MKNLKHIHIGKFIRLRVGESGIDTTRICNFLDCDEKRLEKMYEKETLEADLILRWSKLLEYDFFRLYTQHLVFYSPQKAMEYNNSKNAKSALPQFKKNIYTKEMIEFIMEVVESGRKTKSEVISEYRIPKTTLYKWLTKYKTEENGK